MNRAKLYLKRFETHRRRKMHKSVRGRALFVSRKMARIRNWKLAVENYSADIQAFQCKKFCTNITVHFCVVPCPHFPLYRLPLQCWAINDPVQESHSWNNSPKASMYRAASGGTEMENYPLPTSTHRKSHHTKRLIMASLGNYKPHAPHWKTLISNKPLWQRQIHSSYIRTCIRLIFGGMPWNWRCGTWGTIR